MGRPGTNNVGGGEVGVGDDAGGSGDDIAVGDCGCLWQTIRGGVVGATVEVGTIGGIPG